MIRLCFRDGASWGGVSWMDMWPNTERMSMELIERLTKAILSLRSDAIIATDRDGVIRFWNPGAERIFGYSNEEAIGQSLNLIIPERLRARHWTGFANVLRSGQSRYGDHDLLSVPARRKDGTTISIQFTIASLKEAGEMVGMAAIIRDVTQQFNETRDLKRKLAGIGSSDREAHLRSLAGRLQFNVEKAGDLFTLTRTSEVSRLVRHEALTMDEAQLLGTWKLRGLQGG